MGPCSHLLLHIFILLHLNICFLSAYVPLENIALDCGSSYFQSLSFDGRNWTGDIRSKFVDFRHANSSPSTASSTQPGVPQVPYKTARLFYSEFTYTFNVTPGPKFVRLHFYPSSYSGLDASKAFLSVKDGYHHTLLSNFSASLTANYRSVNAFVKEFIIHVQNHSLLLIFSPSSNASDAFAFVNGIEVVSMPQHLYARGKNAPLPLVGNPAAVFTLDNTTSALETVYRINVGGDDVSPISDSGMFRTWTMDDPYIFGSAGGQLAFDFDLSVRYTSTTPAYSAPDMVYRTSRYMGIYSYSQIYLNYNLSWFFPVETGFKYLVRLHFCEVDRNITKINQKVFHIYINNQTAEDQADVIGWSGGQGVPTYKDYVIMVIQEKGGQAIQDLWLELHPNAEMKPQFYDAFLNGVEIFKLSSYDGNLAGPNPYQQLQGLPVNPSSTSTRSSKKRLVRIIGCLLVGVTLTFIMVSVLIFCIRAERKKSEKSNKTSHSQSVCRYFTMKEIKAATNNLNESRVIGAGGFGKVYKGHINGGMTTVAIKRGNHPQCFGEFHAEIKTLSLLRHQNVVSLIGYCNDEQEMILVYEYMPNGTLFEHLHFANEERKLPLTWNQRLQICIGAAQGLCYLHTGMKLQIVHRDVKTSNILLDQNWVAKISDFGLSKIDPANGSTKVKGSIGYLDPEYCQTHKLTDKSDVYSFGVVLLEVLSARFVLNPLTAAEDYNHNQEDEDIISFVDWALNCYGNDDLDQLIDPHLEGKIVLRSLAKFMEITKKCLAEQGLDRPTMSEVLWNVELALQLQIHEPDKDRTMSSGLVGKNSDLTPGVEFSEIMIPVGR